MADDRYLGRSRAREILPVVEAVAEGRAVQYRRTWDGSGMWINPKHPDKLRVLDTSYEWRVKPTTSELDMKEVALELESVHACIRRINKILERNGQDEGVITGRMYY